MRNIQFNLKTKLIFLTLSAAVLPVMVVGLWSVSVATGSLFEGAYAHLEAVAVNKKALVEALFAKAGETLRSAAAQPSMPIYFEEFEAIGLEPDVGFDSPEYQAAEKDYAPALKSLAAGFQDLYLISNDGDVVYSVTRGTEFTKNLRKDPAFAKSALARAHQRALNEQKMVFEDFSLYPGAAGAKPAAFLAVPLAFDKKIIGVLAARLDSDEIGGVVEKHADVVESYNAYLVGPDKKVRSDIADANISLADSLAGKAELRGDGSEAVDRALRGESGRRVFTNWGGTQKVAAVFTPVRVFEHDWALIVAIDESKMRAPVTSFITQVSLVGAGMFALVLLLGSGVTVSILRQLGADPAQIAKITEQVAAGNLDVQWDSGQESYGIYASVQKMVKNLRAVNAEREQQNWLKSGQAQLNEKTSGEQEVMQLAENVINFLTPYVNAQVGAFYIAEGKNQENMSLKMLASYAYTQRGNLSNRCKLGEGLLGQAALEHKPIMVTDLPKNHLRIDTGLGVSSPRAVLIMPFLYEGELKGVIELAAVHEFDKAKREFMEQMMPTVAIAVNTAESRSRMQELLEQSQAQAEELQAQQEALRQTSEDQEMRSRKFGTT